MVEKNLRLNISFTFLGKFIGLFAPFAISELLLKNLGVTEYSDYLLLMQLLAIMTLLDFGIVNGCARVLNRIATKSAKLATVVLLHSLKNVLTISLAVSIAAYLLIKNTSSLNNEVLILLISIYFVAQAYRLSSVLLIANNQIYLTQIIETFTVLMRLLLLIVFLQFGWLSLFSAIGVYLIMSAVQVVLVSQPVFRLISLKSPVKSRAMVGKLISYFSEHSFYISISNYGTSALFPFLLWFMNETSMHIVFSLAVLISTSLSLFPSIVGTVFAPISASISSAKVTTYGRDYANIVRLNLAFASLLYGLSLFCIVLIGQTGFVQILTVLAAENNIYITALVLLGLITNVVNNNLRSFIVNRFDPKSISFSDIGIFIFTVICSLFAYILFEKPEFFIFFWLLGGLLRATRSWVIFNRLISAGSKPYSHFEGLFYLFVLSSLVAWLVASYEGL